MTSVLRTAPSHLLSIVGLLAACSGAEAGSSPAHESSSSGDDVDQRATTLAQSLSPSDDSSAEGASSYLLARRDLRRCASPLCGGFFVSRANRLTTECADGSRSDECYVAALDFDALPLRDEQVAAIESAPESFVLRGELVAESSELGELGRLNVTEAWQGHAGTEARGAFLRVVNEGIVCITSPCLSFSAELLNSRLPEVPIAEVDLSGIGSDPGEATTAPWEPDGLLVAALPVIVSGPAGRALGLDASEFYLPLNAAATPCGSRGLPACAEGSFCAFPADADCGRSDRPGVCAPRPEGCTFELDPVCGCDGLTYPNACAAAAAGVSSAFAGECGAASE